MIVCCNTLLQALSTRALLFLNVLQGANSRATGFGGGGGGTLMLMFVEPLAEQAVVPLLEVALTVTLMFVPGATPVVSSRAAKPLPAIVPAVADHS